MLRYRKAVFAAVALLVVALAASIAYAVSSRKPNAQEHPSRGANTISSDEPAMLAAEGPLAGFTAVPFSDPFTQFAQELRREDASPSSPDNCHQMRRATLVKLRSVPMGTIEFRAPTGTGESSYTQSVIHSPDVMDGLLDTNNLCGFSSFTVSADGLFQRRINSLVLTAGRPETDAVTAWSWQTWGVEAAIEEYRLQGIVVAEGKGMLLETTFPVRIDQRKFEAVFEAAVKKFLQAR